MAFQQDWVLRQIETIVQFAARMLFKKDDIDYEIPDPEHMDDTDILYLQINDLVARGKIGAGEDLLFKELEEGNNRHIRLVLDFYQRLNALSDEELLAADFSREEIEEGLRAALKHCGVSLEAV